MKSSQGTKFRPHCQDKDIHERIDLPLGRALASLNRIMPAVPFVYKGKNEALLTDIPRY